MLTIALLFACPPNDSDTDSPPDTEVEYSFDTDAPEAMCAITLACERAPIDDPKGPCSMVITSGDGTVYHSAAGLELRGRTSLYFPKPSYAAELRDYSELPIWPGMDWRYHADGAPDPDWKELDYDDGDWAIGPAVLGYNDPYLETEFEPASTTAYFRHRFVVADLARAREFGVGMMRQDGVAVYLNGTEVGRDNLRADASASTLADDPLPPGEEYNWISFEVDASLLVAGENVVAVEVHRADPDVEELRFDLYLEGYGAQTPVNLLGMGSDEHWVLDGLYADRSLLRNRLAYSTFRAFGANPARYAPQTRFCELTLDGAYQGVYALGERIARDDDRLDIGEGAVPGDTFIVKLDDDGGFHPNAVGYGTWQLVYPPDPSAEARVSDYLGQWESAVEGPAATTADDGVFRYLDLDSAVDWVIINEFMKNADAYLLSVYLWREQGGKMHFTPWDFDLSMGAYPYTDCTPGGWNARQPFVEAMAASPVFRERLQTRWAELRATELAESAILDRIASYDVVLAPAIDRNFERWPIDEIAYNDVAGDNLLCPVETYADEHQSVLDFVAQRLVWIDENIASF